MKMRMDDIRIYLYKKYFKQEFPMGYGEIIAMERTIGGMKMENGYIDQIILNTLYYDVKPLLLPLLLIGTDDIKSKVEKWISILEPQNYNEASIKLFKEQYSFDEEEVKWLMITAVFESLK